MRPIGGELELKPNSYDVFFTDSGRSSIRLFLRSKDNNKKRYLLPDFFCEVIEKVFIEEEIEFIFYKVYDDLSLDVEYINKQDYDVLYVINYFGKRVDLSKINLKEKILIEDNVFYYDFSNYWDAERWYAFNSFRKISTLADGSLVKTNLPIDTKNIQNKEAPFVSKKYKAKAIKYLYIHTEKYKEEDYLELFQNAEKQLDKQSDIYLMSSRSVYQLMQSSIDQKIREIRFNRLKSLFGHYALLSKCEAYSFFVVMVENRNLLRKKLMKNHIYLPIHWPKSTRENRLYDRIISIPLFEIYNDREFDYMIEKLKEYMDEKL